MLGPMWRLSHDRCFAIVRKRSTFGRPNSALWSAAAKYPSNANPIQAMRASTPVNFLITLASLKSPVAGSPVRLNATAPVGPTLSKGLAHALSRLKAWTFYRSTNNDAAFSNIERQCHEICNSGYGSPTQSYQSLRSRGTGSNLPGAYSWSPPLHPLGIQTKIGDGVRERICTTSLSEEATSSNSSPGRTATGAAASQGLLAYAHGVREHVNRVS